MSCSSINQKGMQEIYLDILEWHTFILSVKTLLKTSNNVFFCTHVSYTSFQTFECEFLINKINLIITNMKNYKNKN
jgi:hypothetical protein